ncbi:hypothetical protein [Hymenobacter sp. UYP22]|uniref:hypothetical protein n=1 Tax=Hymenobacter sp. UYP22 TaxID=3156348 RepID=UPI003397737A
MRHVLAALFLVGSCVTARAQHITPTADEAALQNEVAILKRGIVQRKADETDSTFLKRLFPASFYGELIQYAWRPSVHGPQLFFSHGERDEYHSLGEGTELFVLDPIQPDKYAVHVLLLEPIGDITNLAAFFFVDVDQDGQKELLALVYAEVQEAVMLSVGPGNKKERAVGRFSHWETQVFRYTGLNSVTGRPRYQPDRTPRPYLDGLRSAAEVRRALAQHHARTKPRSSRAVK